MKTIYRNHGFENKLNLVQKKRKYFFLYHERSINPVIISITKKGLNAFNSENWEYFENKEEQVF